MPTYPKVIQVANVAPAATREQMKTLFGYVGRIDDIEIYPEKETGNLLTRVCYVKFYDSEDAGVALHLTNTVFIDRALVVTPVPENRIPDERTALASIADSESKSEDVRRTIYVSGLDATVTPDILMNFFGTNAGEVKYGRMAGVEGSAVRSAYIEFSETMSVVRAVSLSGRVLGTRAITVLPATVGINKTAPSTSGSKGNDDFDSDTDGHRSSRSRSGSRSRHARSRSQRSRSHRSQSRRSVIVKNTEAETPSWFSVVDTSANHNTIQNAGSRSRLSHRRSSSPKRKSPSPKRRKSRSRSRSRDRRRRSKSPRSRPNRSNSYSKSKKTSHSPSYDEMENPDWEDRRRGELSRSKDASRYRARSPKVSKSPARRGSDRRDSDRGVERDRGRKSSSNNKDRKRDYDGKKEHKSSSSSSKHRRHPDPEEESEEEEEMDEVEAKKKKASGRGYERDQEEYGDGEEESETEEKSESGGRRSDADDAEDEPEEEEPEEDDEDDRHRRHRSHTSKRADSDDDDD